MSLSIGIVGLPNVGKSTLFNALLKKQQALVANYPFATIDPNVGVVEVPDSRLEKLAGISKSGRVVRATVEFVDIAGLVAGASTGAGLGNKFLSHIREVDMIVQVLRDFEDKDIVKEGSVDPESDYQTITTELILRDLETVMRIAESKEVRVKGMEKKKSICERLISAFDNGKRAIDVLSAEELAEVRDLGLLTAKKEIRIYNVAETDPRLKEDGDNVYISAKLESELAGLSESDARDYLNELGIRVSGLDKLVAKAYETLGLQSFLTTGEMESRAWTIRRGWKAPECAGVIHTDFEKHFIKAKVMNFDDFVTCGGWKAGAEVGKVRMEGRDYVMKEGDVVEFMIGR
jgi:ribosome-binding ATPase